MDDEVVVKYDAEIGLNPADYMHADLLHQHQYKKVLDAIIDTDEIVKWRFDSTNVTIESGQTVSVPLATEHHSKWVEPNYVVALKYTATGSPKFPGSGNGVLSSIEQELGGQQLPIMMNHQIYDLGYKVLNCPDPKYSRVLSYNEEYKLSPATYSGSFTYPAGNYPPSQTPPIDTQDITNIQQSDAGGEIQHITFSGSGYLLLSLKSLGSMFDFPHLLPNNKTRPELRLNFASAINQDPSNYLTFNGGASYVFASVKTLKPDIANRLNNILDNGTYRMIMKCPKPSTGQIQTGTAEQDVLITHGGSQSTEGVYLMLYGQNATNPSFNPLLGDSANFQLQYGAKVIPQTVSRERDIIKMSCEALKLNKDVSLDRQLTNNVLFKEDGTLSSRNRCYYIPFSKMTKYDDEIDLIQGLPLNITETFNVHGAWNNSTGGDLIQTNTLRAYFVDKKEVFISQGNVRII